MATVTRAPGALTPLQVRILDHVADGHERAEAAAHLGLSEFAVKAHLRTISRRTGHGTRAGMVGYAYRRGLLVPRPDARRVLLTERQFEMVRGVARGLTNEELGAEVELSPHTVKTHLGKLFAALGARNRAHAVRRAIDTGALPLVAKQAPR